MINIVTPDGNLTLDASNEIGVGAEGSVYSDGNYAYKILSEHMLSSGTIDKVRAMMRKGGLHDQVVKPLDIVRDSSGQEVGFMMDVLDPTYDTLEKWIKNPSFRKSEMIELADIHRVFAEVREIMVHLHAAGYRLGDFNEGGILVLRKSLWTASDPVVRIVDANSFEFDHYPCPTWNLQGYDYRRQKLLTRIGSDTIYDQHHDWFAYSSLFFSALTMVRVYDGYHDIYITPKAMFQNGYTVLSDEIEYPLSDFVLPFESLPDRHRDYFRSSFLDQVELVDESLLTGRYQPVTQNRQRERYGSTGGMVSDVLYVAAHDEEIRGVYRALDGTLYVHTRKLNKPHYGAYRLSAGNATNHLVDEYIVTDDASTGAGGYPLTLTPSVVEYVHHRNERDELESSGIVSKRGYAGCSMLKSSSYGVYFYNANSVCFAPHSNYLVSKVLFGVTSNSEIVVDYETGNVAALLRDARVHNMIFYRNGYTFIVPIDAIGGRIVQWDCLYSGNHALLVVRVENKQKQTENIELFEINLTSSNSVKDNERVELRYAMRGVEFNPLNSATYVYREDVSSYIFYANRKGIVRESLDDGEAKIWSTNEVQLGHYVSLHESGILVRTPSRLFVLKP